MNYFVFSIRHFLIPRKGRFFDTKKVICAFVVTPNVSSDDLLLTAKILRDDEEMFLDDLAQQIRENGLNLYRVGSKDFVSYQDVQVIDFERYRRHAKRMTLEELADALPTMRSGLHIIELPNCLR